MRNGKEIIFILVFIFSISNIFSNGKKESNTVNQVEQYFLSKKTLKTLEKKALEGSIDAALKVWEY